MTYALVFRRRAAEEVYTARRWYEAQKPGLGARFEAAVTRALEHIADNPALFPRIRGEIRRAVVREFPYGIYFQVQDQSVVVVAVIHARRNPRRWQSRR